MKKLVFFILSQLLLVSIYSQDPQNHFNRITEPHGLADYSIDCILQDRAGLIWFGGYHGLYQYNGYNIRFFKDLPGCEETISFRRVFSICEDSLGLLWIISEAGITVFDPEKERSKQIYMFVQDSSFSLLTDLMDIICDHRGIIWASIPAGLVKISIIASFKKTVSKDIVFKYKIDQIFQTDKIHLSSNISAPENRVSCVYEDDRRNIWVGCVKGLYVLRNTDHHFTRVDNKQARVSDPGLSDISDILQVDDDSYWIASADGLYLLSNVKQALGKHVPETELLKFAKKNIRDGQFGYTLFVDRKRNFIVGTNKELFHIKKDQNTGDYKFESQYSNFWEPGEKKTDKLIKSIFEDRSGQIWIGHIYFGIITFRLEQKFTSFNDLVSKDFLSSDINPIFIDVLKNKWVGSWGGGLYKIQSKDNGIKHYDFGLPWDNINCMTETSPGYFWIGSCGGILEFNMLTGKHRDPLPEGRTADILRKSAIREILKDGDQIYIASMCGLFVYSISGRKLYHHVFNKNDSAWDFFNAAESLLKMRNGEIWTTTALQGINKIKFNPETGALSLIPVVSIKSLKEKDIDLTYYGRIHEDSKGKLWIVCKSGLHSFDLKTGAITTHRLSEKSEFPEAWSVIEDDNRNLWIGTHIGLCRFNMETGKVRIFGKDDGIPIVSHGTNSVFKDKGGRLYFGGVGGFYSFHPESLKTNNYIPSVIITDFKLFNKSVRVDTTKNAVLTKNISYTRSIKLKHNQNDFSFEFAALDYSQPLRNKYSYRLVGFQNEWIETDATNRVANYTNLDPGSYTFRVKGSNNDDIWNEAGTSVAIIIHKPWWYTSVALLVYIAVLLGAIGGFIRWRLWRIEKEKMVLEYQVEERTKQIEEQKEEILSQRDMLEHQNQQIIELDEIKNRFFTNISHEFRTPLSLIQSPVEEMLNDPRRNEKERRKLNMVQRHARRLLNLVNQLLDISKIDGSNMKLELVEADVMKHLSAIAGSFSSLAETKSIGYHLNFSKEELKTWFDWDKIEKIAINLLSNAFKYTPEGGEIIFNARYKKVNDPVIPLVLDFSVTDTGTGIPEDSLKKIFDRFYQVESSLKREVGGTGIGLSLSRDLAILMHGNISVNSELCKGSTFIVEVPLGKSHLNEPEFILLKNLPGSGIFVPEVYEQIDAVTSHQENLLNIEKPVILIVEDNRDIRMQLIDNLNLEYTLVEAVDGIAGLKKATEMIPDLILTDLMMPRMDGIMFCNKLKNDERTSHIPIIMLTAKVTLENKITGFQTGADDYISKPFNMAEIKARVSNLIEQRKRLRERFSREIILEPGDISITPIDEQFLKKAIIIVEKHLSDENFDLPGFSDDMNMSRSTLFRKLHALTDQSPTEFIRTIRLKRAANLLKQNFGNVTQVSMEVGFNNLSYFNRSFKKHFGVSPLQYVKTN